jgi:hypothetical protein
MAGDLPLEQLVRLVTQEVMRELARQKTTPGIPVGVAAAADPATSVRLDMGKYKTPIVTEQALARLHDRTSTIIVPAGSIVTPRAKELLREKNISVVFE